MRNVEAGGQMYFWSDLPTLPTFQRNERSASLYNILPDDNDRFSLSLDTLSGAFGDVFIQMHDTQPDFGNIDNLKIFSAIRLRSYYGGGLNPFITEGFMSILNYYENGMQETPGVDIKKREKLNSNSSLTATRGKGKEPKLSIVGIQDDDGEPRFLDIFVLQRGDVKLQIRDFTYAEIHDDEPTVGEMLFKTKENGGQNPFITAALTNLAERIANAKRG